MSTIKWGSLKLTQLLSTFVKWTCSTYTTSLGTRKPTRCPRVSLILITQYHWIRNTVSVDRDYSKQESWLL